jgi:hypothetical protein
MRHHFFTKKNQKPSPKNQKPSPKNQKYSPKNQKYSSKVCTIQQSCPKNQKSDNVVRWV